METLGFTAIFGTNKGYGHNNEETVDLSDFGKKWQKHMQKEFNDTNILVGCVIHKSLTVYPVSFGCPIGGEGTVTVLGHYNPKYFPDSQYPDNYLDKLKNITKIICRKMQKELKQTTVSLTFHKIEDFVYLVDEEVLEEKRARLGQPSMVINPKIGSRAMKGNKK